MYLYDEDKYLLDLAKSYENRKPIDYEDSDLARYQEHEWEQEDER